MLSLIQFWLCSLKSWTTVNSHDSQLSDMGNKNAEQMIFESRGVQIGENSVRYMTTGCCMHYMVHLSPLKVHRLQLFQRGLMPVSCFLFLWNLDQCIYVMLRLAVMIIGELGFLDRKIKGSLVQKKQKNKIETGIQFSLPKREYN